MPNAIDIMKNISMFNTDEHFDDNEAKEELSMLFHTLIMNDEPSAREFFERFLTGTGNIIKDMGLIDDAGSEDEVDTDIAPEEEVPAEDPMGEVPADTPEGGEEADTEVPDELMGDSYNPSWVNHANSFLY